jgi:hypothetical protein
MMLHNSRKRFRLGAFGRQSGKSTWAANELLKVGWENPETRYWHMMPTFAQCKIQYRRVVNSLFTCPQATVKKNISELRVKLASQSDLSWKSGEVLDNLRGETLHGAILDEVRDLHKDLWPMVIRPMLATTKGFAGFISTPNGFDAFYDLYQHAKENPADWDVFQFPSTINPLFTLEEYEAARRTMSEKQFRQEILAEFLDLTAGKAYWAFGEHNVNTEPFWSYDPETRIDANKPIVLGLDFNLNPMSWTLGQTDWRRWFWFKEIYLENSNTQEASECLYQLLAEYREKGMLRSDPQLLVVGDAAGRAGQRAAAGQSDYDILFGMLREKGFTYDNLTPESNPLVKDRINAVNGVCRTADGETLLRVHPTGCPKLMRDLQRVTWKEGKHVLDKSKDTTLTHASDGVGYAIYKLTPVREIKDVGTPVVIQY